MSGIVGKPEMRVEVGFGSGATTAPGSISWTDVSTYVRQKDKISWSWGRTDERSDVGASSATLTLDNVAGRFTPANVSGANYPNVLIRTPIRISMKPPAGAWTVTWTGLVDSWTPKLINGVQPVCVVSASDRLARMSRRALACWETEQTLAAGPSFLWPLTDDAGTTTTADVASGTTLYPLTLTHLSTGGYADFQSGALPIDDGTVLALTPASSTSGYYFTGSVDVPSTGVSPGVWIGQGFSCLMNTTTTSASVLHRITDLYGSYIQVSVTAAGKAQFYYWDAWGWGTATITSAASVNDAAWHQIGATVDATGNVTLYIDGASAGTSAIPYPLSGKSFTIAGISTGSLFSGQISHCAIWADQAVSATWMTDACAAMTGAVGERTDQRFTRIAGWLGRTVAPATAAGTMGPQKTAGKTGADALNDVADAEQGVFYITADGEPALSPRTARYSPVITLSLTNADIGADTDFGLDDVDLINKSSVKRATGATFTHIVQSSIDQYEVHDESLELAVETDVQAAAIAQWRANTGSTPGPRVDSLTIDAWSKQSGINLTTLLGVTVSSKLHISGLPTSAPAATLDLFVEGGSDEVDHTSWVRTLNTTDATRSGQVWVLGDPTYGVLGSTNRLAL